MTDDSIERARAADVNVLLVTVDVPTASKRVRDLVNGLSLPMRPTIGTLVDLARHPRWLLRSLRHGAPRSKCSPAIFFPINPGR